jgi:riboflavin kinase/FMN adenylyltransferase
VRVEHRGRRYNGAGYVGPRPTFGGGQPVLEVYLFNFDGDLYDEEIEVEFMSHLRADATFANGEELAAQMRDDCRKAQALLMMCEASDPITHFPLARALSSSTGL